MRDRTAREQVERQAIQVALLQADLRKLEERMEGVEKPIRDLEMEWEDWFEKFRNLYARINKRRQREEPEPEKDEAPPSPRAINPLAQRLLNLAGNE